MQNYFELLGVSQSFEVNLNDLEASYIILQQAAHPDRQVGKSDAERIAAIERSMAANDAYETLKKPLSRAEHLLALQGIIVNSDKETHKPDHALLMETLEMREALEDAKQDGRALEQHVADLKRAMQQCTEDMEEAFEARDYVHAAQRTIKLQYLGKSLEEAYAYIYHLKASLNEGH
jgi:molecular chaperone HscB